MTSNSPDDLASQLRYAEEIRQLNSRKTVIDRLIHCLEEYNRLKPIEAQKKQPRPIRKPARSAPSNERQADLRRLAS